MDRYELISSLFESLTSLAWPIAFAFTAWLFRERIVELLPLLRVKYKDFDMSFRLDQAEKDAAALPPPMGEPLPEATPEERTKFEQLAELSPRAAILDVRSELEESVRRMAERFVSPSKRPWTLLTATRELRLRQLISPQTSALLDDLRAVGNAAAHRRESEFTKEEALRYREIADQAIAQLQDAYSPQLQDFSDRES